MNIKSAVLAAAFGCSLTVGLSAQSPDGQAPPKRGRWELNVPSGALVPTGDQRDAIKRANMSAVQVTFLATRVFAVTTTGGWARSRDVASAGTPKLDVFTYDVGAELRTPRTAAKGMTFSGFAGLGGGGRSYNYRKLDIDATHNLSAYGSVGGEAGFRRVRLRIEARDYVSEFKPLAGLGESRTGNDVVIMAGLRLVSR
jgi:hypothetical protein